LEDLVTRQAEHVQDCADQIDNWIQAFDMAQNEEGVWQWSNAYTGGKEWLGKYVDLVSDWNKFVGDYNATVRPRNVGRPLAASEAQAQQVLKLHESGTSLRALADETSLGLRTIRTIIERRNKSDRTTRRYLERIKPDKERERAWLAKQRTRDALPQQIHATRKMCDELAKEAKGLGR
jgi:hypothetical protein